MPKKQSSSKVSSLASKVLAGKKPTPSEAKSLAASVLSQDEKKASISDARWHPATKLGAALTPQM